MNCPIGGDCPIAGYSFLRSRAIWRPSDPLAVGLHGYDRATRHRVQWERRQWRGEYAHQCHRATGATTRQAARDRRAHKMAVLSGSTAILTVFGSAAGAYWGSQAPPASASSQKRIVLPAK